MTLTFETGVGEKDEPDVRDGGFIGNHGQDITKNCKENKGINIRNDRAMITIMNWQRNTENENKSHTTRRLMTMKKTSETTGR